ncbi:MAG: hypothetical protein AB7F88_09955 [Pyrinomonadaceae bacterium]
MVGLVDNDVLLKLASYDLFAELLVPSEDLGVLGAAEYVLRKAIQKRVQNERTQKVLATLNEFINEAEIVEPTEEEQIMAANLELAAQLAGAPLDVGESQLCAILIVRKLSWLFTGDKRAIEALEVLLDTNEELQTLCGKVVCLEQMVLRSMSEDNYSSIRAAICVEPEADKVLKICFSCRGMDVVVETIKECLNSYVDDLHKKAPRVLFNPVANVDCVGLDYIGN